MSCHQQWDHCYDYVPDLFSGFRDCLWSGLVCAEPSAAAARSRLDRQDRGRGCYVRNLDLASSESCWWRQWTSSTQIREIDMSEEERVRQVPGNLGKTILLPVNAALAAAEREALKLGVPTHEIIQLLLDHLTSIVGHIEPSGVRAQTLKDVVAAIPVLVKKHVELRHMTPGGIVLPRGNGREPELNL